MAKKRKISTKTAQPGKKVPKKSKTTKPRVNPMIFIVIGTVLILTALLLNVNSPDHTDQVNDWQVDEYGIMSYPADRDIPIFESTIINDTPDYSLESIIFSSRDAQIAALLRIPNSSEPVPGILILPGATVSKEGEQGLSEELAGMGYASMVIDQRNLGGVDVQPDSQLFEAGEEPVEHKMVFDALKAVDVMRQHPGIDKDNIAIIGISNGGRFAIIATAIDPSIKGVVGISTSGYDMEAYINQNAGQITMNQTRFLRSIDPDSYLDKLPPRKIAMIHMLNDSIIPMELAQATYNKADDPRVFYPIEGEGHGYNGAMRNALETELGIILRTTRK
jgi:dienelactone hydrolase